MVYACKYCGFTFLNSDSFDLHDGVCQSNPANWPALEKMKEFVAKNMLTEEQIAERQTAKNGTDHVYFQEAMFAYYDDLLKQSEKPKPSAAGPAAPRVAAQPRSAARKDAVQMTLDF